MTDSTLAVTPTTSAQILRTLGNSQEALIAVFGLLIISVFLSYGWGIREQAYLNPETGIGYTLGIAGSSLMLLLLLYPIRKHARVARNWGRVKYWFQAHMLCGIAGPLCILYHCNFSLGSTNSNVTLFSMLTVAGSGIFGRYFYTRIHYGLYGQKAKVTELRSVQVYAEAQLDDVFALAPQLKDRIERIGNIPNTWLPRFLITGLLMHWHYLALKPALNRAFRIAADRKQWPTDVHHRKIVAARSHISAFLAASRKAHEFALYQRLFSLWHVLHVPLFIMLVLSATVHIVAVHMY